MTIALEYISMHLFRWGYTFNDFDGFSTLIQKLALAFAEYMVNKIATHKHTKYAANNGSLTVLDSTKLVL